MRQVNLLVVLDGFGYNEDSTHNAIAKADTPNWDALWQKRPHTLISGSGAMWVCPTDRWAIQK